MVLLMLTPLKQVVGGREGYGHDILFGAFLSSKLKFCYYCVVVLDRYVTK